MVKVIPLGLLAAVASLQVDPPPQPRRSCQREGQPRRQMRCHRNPLRGAGQDSSKPFWFPSRHSRPPPPLHGRRIWAGQRVEGGQVGAGDDAARGSRAHDEIGIWRAASPARCCAHAAHHHKRGVLGGSVHSHGCYGLREAAISLPLRRGITRRALGRGVVAV